MMNNLAIAKSASNLFKALLKPSVRLFGRKKKDKQPMDAIEAELDKLTEPTREESMMRVDEYGEKLPEEGVEGQQDEQEVIDGRVIEVDQKFVKQSSELYKKFLIGQERPMLTKDNYQFNFGIILHRLPIFLPYNQHLHKIIRQKYTIAHKTGFYNSVPKAFTEFMSSPQQAVERQSLDNLITHLKKLPDGGREIYAQNSKYWKLVDPNVKDESSIQTKPSDMVFLIVKNEQGDWVFPDQPVREKEKTFEDARKSFISTLTGYKNTAFHWLSAKPIFVHKREAEVPRGVGIKTFYFHAVHLAGRMVTEGEGASVWKEHKWVPKGQLAQHLKPDYFNTMIRSVTAIM